MTTVVTIAGSPSAPSRSSAIAAYAAARLRAQAFEVASIQVRDLPADALLTARTSDPLLAAAIQLVAQADAVVIVTPVYKASFSGVLKTFLDVLPQRALAGKVVLPLSTGGTLAHLLALDYALRPVLVALGAPQITTGGFVLDQAITLTPDGHDIEHEANQRLGNVVDDFAAAIDRAAIDLSVRSVQSPCQQVNLEGAARTE